MHDIFYFTDVHGMYNLYRAAIDYCLEQDPECSIIYGGDACDRGKDGYKIMKELLDNPQVLYLKGNHEDLFVHAAWAIQKIYKGSLESYNISNFLYTQEIKDTGDKAIQIHLYNGGYYTLYEWMMDGMPDEFVQRINKLPATFSYEDLDFCHAGGRFTEFQNAADSEYHNEFIDKDDLNMILWDRNYLSQGWATTRTCIFGHTATIHLASKYYGKDKSMDAIHPCSYIGQLDDRWTGRKIDMDTGTAHSKKLYVLNCLTMKAQGFKEGIFDDNEKVNVKKIECIQM